MTLVNPFLLREEEALPTNADTCVREELVTFWKARADGEWTTATALQHVLSDLDAFGAPESLKSLVTTSIEDERRHTAWCTAMVQRLGGTPFEPIVKGDKPLAFQGATESENAIFRCIFTGCISETIALHVLRRSHRDITSVKVREVNRQHMAEEVNHARVGWGFLAWLDATGRLNAATSKTLESVLPSLVDLSVQSWLQAASEHDPKLACFGAIQRSHVETGIREAIHEVIVPGFSRYSLTLATAPNIPPTQK